MKIGRYESAGRIFHGEPEGDKIIPLRGEFGSFSRDESASPIAHSDARVLAPAVPGKIIALGPGHNNMLPEGYDPPERPYLFFKPSTTLANPGDPIVYPATVDNILYELEIAVVIGKTATNVSEADALDHVLGYTCCNDVTAGSLEKDWGTQFSYHWKAFDTFGPLGPVINTDHNIEGLAMVSRLNGEEHARTEVSLIYTPADIVSWVSGIMTLNPGDVIAMGAAAKCDLRVGDEIELEIEGIGTLANKVIAANT